MAAATAALSLNSAYTPNLIRPLTYSYSSSSLRSFSGLQLRGGALPVTRIAVARQGGRHYRRPIGGRRRRSDVMLTDPNYDPSLDLDRIGSNSVRLLDQEQNMVGIVSLDEAIQMADDSELVLAILSPDADPPVLRLFDSEEYKKHKYEQQKKKRVQQKRSLANRVDIKEVKMGYNIDSHDYSVRLRAAKRFLSDGDKVKVIVNLKRRENEFKDNAIELLKRFQTDVGELATQESRNFNLRDIFMVLMPNKALIQKTHEQPKKEEQAKGPLKEPAQPKKEEQAKGPLEEPAREPAKEVSASV